MSETEAARAALEVTAGALAALRDRAARTARSR